MDIFQHKEDPIDGGQTAEDKPCETVEQVENTEQAQIPKAPDEDFWEGLSVAYKPVKRKKHRLRRRLVSALMAVVFMAVGFGIAMVTARGQGWIANLVRGDEHITFNLPLAEKPQVDDTFKTEDGRYTTEGLAQAVAPTVVSLDIYGEGAVYAPTGQGSGIIMTSDGYIVTNAHVVAAAVNGIKAVLWDNSEYSAKIIGVDKKTDIAVLKIPVTNLQYAEFADSDSVLLGEQVAAIGSAAGYYGSMSFGIVSGLDRSVRTQNSLNSVKCIQVDAAINPGNSGGALFNMWGQVIGITSSKLISDQYEGIGFAIATNEAKPIIEQLMASGKVADRVKIGISFYSISDTTAQMYGLKYSGICVAGISDDCDVANTELAVGDIITEIDGKKVLEFDDISDVLEGKQPDDEITCHVYREPSAESEEKEFDITFKLMADEGTFIIE